MKEPTDIGGNKTGIDSALARTREMLEGQQPPTSGPDAGAGALAEARRIYIEDAEPVGTVPPPARLKGMAKSALKALKGEKATVFIDKLAERLAYERTGSRLWETFLGKLEVLGIPEGGPTLDDAQEIYTDERRHFDLLRQVIQDMGADPTAQTPSADLAGVAAAGLLQVVSDARTGVRESLQALLHAELGDNDGWLLLIELARELDEDELATEFEQALAAEELHLQRVRTWLRQLTRLEAEGVAPPRRASMGVPAGGPPRAVESAVIDVEVISDDVGDADVAEPAAAVEVRSRTTSRRPQAARASSSRGRSGGGRASGGRGGKRS